MLVTEETGYIEPIEAHEQGFDCTGIFAFVLWGVGHHLKGKLLMELVKQSAKDNLLMQFRLDSTQQLRLCDPILVIQTREFEKIMGIMRNSIGHEIALTQLEDGCELRLDSGLSVNLKAMGVQFELRSLGAPPDYRTDFDGVARKVGMERRGALRRAFVQVFGSNWQVD
jgi:hypothetical protein